MTTLRVQSTERMNNNPMLFLYTPFGVYINERDSNGNIVKTNSGCIPLHQPQSSIYEGEIIENSSWSSKEKYYALRNGRYVYEVLTEEIVYN